MANNTAPVRSPSGWSFDQQQDGSIVVKADSYGEVVVRPDDSDSIAAAMLHMLARDLASAPPSAPVGLEAELRKLCSWKHLMSYNESYFGEPEGELKSSVYATERALSQQPAAPSGEAVAQTLRDALAFAGHETAGDLQELAERTEFCVRENHSLVRSQAKLIEKIQSRTAPQQPAAVDGITVDVLRIPAQPGLDPIVVYFEDYAPGRGRITVACYGDAWTAAWGAMGDRTVREFVSSVDPHYLAGSMEETTRTTKGRRKYAERIAKAVIAALAAQQQRGA